MRPRPTRCICSDAWLVVCELTVAAAVEHAVYLENIAVRPSTAEFVACAVEAEHKALPLAANGWSFSRRPIIHLICCLPGASMLMFREQSREEG